MTALILNWRQAYEAGVLSCGGKGYHLPVCYPVLSRPTH
jgi:hypothetical protein